MSVSFSGFEFVSIKATRKWLANPIKHTSSERIGALYKVAVEDPSLTNNMLVLLGVDKNDESALSVLTPFLRESAGLSFHRSDSYPSGVFEVCDSRQNPVGLFKLGHRRAEIEPAMRKLAFLLGLAECMIPSMPCAIVNAPINFVPTGRWPASPAMSSDFDEQEAPLSSDPEVEDSEEELSANSGTEAEDSEEMEETVEQLYRGTFKRFLSGSETAKVVGVIEPLLGITSIDEREEESFMAFARQLLFCCAAGLRDGKPDGIVWTKDGDHEICFVNVDAEEVMPNYGSPTPDQIDGQMAKTVLHLPLLKMQSSSGEKKSYAKRNFSEKQLKALRAIVEEWQPVSIVATLSSLRHSFADYASEEKKPKKKCTDEGGYRVKIELIDQEEGVQEASVSHQQPLFSSPQREALNERLVALKRALMQPGAIRCPYDLVKAVDPYYAGWLTLSLQAFTSDGPASPLVTPECRFEETVYDMVGRKTPQQLGVIVDAQDLAGKSLPTRSPTATTQSSGSSPKVALSAFSKPTSQGRD